MFVGRYGTFLTTAEKMCLFRLTGDFVYVWKNWLYTHIQNIIWEWRKWWTWKQYWTGLGVSKTEPRGIKVIIEHNIACSYVTKKYGWYVKTKWNFSVIFTMHYFYSGLLHNIVHYHINNFCEFTHSKSDKSWAFPCLIGEVVSKLIHEGLRIGGLSR